MKKISLVMLERESLPGLEALRAAGMIHIEHVKPPGGQQLHRLQEERAMLVRTVAVLSQAEQPPPSDVPADWESIAKDVLSASEQIESLKEEMVKRQALIQQWEPWGDFDPADIHLLEGRGIFVQLAEISERQLSGIPPGIICEKIFSRGKIAGCLLISHGTKEVPVRGMSLPPAGLAELRDRQQASEAKIAELQEAIRARAPYRQGFQKILEAVEADLIFHEVYAGRGTEGSLIYLKGFCPVNRCPDLERLAGKEGWAILSEDPSPEDKVPTLLRHPAWVRLIEPVYKMMNIIPGYRELDISPFFLVFFSIFFGMLVGDAGYGFLFLLFTLLAHWKLGAKMADKAFLYLSYVLSSVTIIWGLLTGTVFGTLLFKQVFKPLLPWLTEIDNVQMLCFGLGAVHLTISHAWRLINKTPKVIPMLSEVGWIILLWASFFLAKTLILGDPFPEIFKYLAGAAVFLIVMDIIAQKQDMAVNLILLVFGIIGIFTDVVSYIRLFAVGLAGVSIADAFNQMALDIGFQGVIPAVFAAIILMFVHFFLNLVLAILGVLVHGLRLNILEFSSHLNLEWSGIRYEPFRNLKET